jgi:3-oxoacyl-[acyl-carrier protein] reductase
MDLGIKGRRALVIGGSRGMGFACAATLAAEGVDVVIVGRKAASLSEAKQAIEAACGSHVATAQADITTVEGRATALASCPEPDILINNGDGEPPGDFRHWTREDWHRGIDKMMLAPIEMIKGTVDGMTARGFGRIVNIVSRSVKIPQSELGLSNAARSGLVGFCSGLARDLVVHNVTINNILPGIISSDAQRDHVRALATQEGRPFEDIWAERARQNPARRYGEPSEVGAYIAFLCSAKAGFVTAQNLLIDGGQYPGTY